MPDVMRPSTQISENQGRAMHEKEIREAISTEHARAMLKISMTLKKDEMVFLRNFLISVEKCYSRSIKTTEDFQEIADILLRDKKIEYGGYTLLKAYFTDVKNRDLVEILSTAEENIAEISKTRKDDGTEENRSILLYHADLAVDLKRIIIPSQLDDLILFFRRIYRGKMKEIHSFDEMWEELERMKEIRPGKYDILKRALHSIQATSHLQVINQCEEKINSEGKISQKWILERICKISSLEHLTQLKQAYEARLKMNDCPGVVFENCTMGNIGHEGGKLWLLSGSATLDVPPSAVENEDLFWMFDGHISGPQFKVVSANGSVTDSDRIAKYSVPVSLGPSGASFNVAVMLTMKDFSKPPENGSSNGMCVYCKVDGGTEWTHVGSYLYSKPDNFTTTILLKRFSSYVLGMPVSSDLPPLNVRVMVQSRPVNAAGDENAGNRIHVYFTVNDYSFSQEFVLHNRINVESATCLYLDPNRDVSVTWVRRHSTEKSVKQAKKEVLQREHIQNLAEMPVSLPIAIADGSGSAHIAEADTVFEEILILEQNDEVLVELPLTEYAVPTGIHEEAHQETDLSERLMKATLDGNKNEVEKLLREGANIETRDQDGNTPISLASKTGHIGIVQLLLERNASVETVNSDGWYTIHIACKYGHENVVKPLLDKYVNVEIQTKAGATAIYIASQNGHEKVVQLLLDKAADIERKADKGASPLYIASQNGHERVVQLLLDKGADIESKTDWGASPLYIASDNGREKVVQLLLDKGADIEIKTEWGIFPLYIASDNGHEKVVKLLLDKGADTENRANLKASPLYVASKNGHEKVVQLLLDKGANTESRTEKGASPLCVATENGHEKVVQLLLDSGAYIEHESLHIASENCHEKIVQLLLDKCADTEKTADWMGSPLHIASQYGHEKFVQLLLDKGADTENKTRKGATPLFVASQKGYEKVVQLLLDKGADIENKTRKGASPLFVASQNGHENVVQLLLDNGADSESGPCMGDSPLNAASKNGHREVVQLLKRRNRRLDKLRLKKAVTEHEKSEENSDSSMFSLRRSFLPCGKGKPKPVEEPKTDSFDGFAPHSPTYQSLSLPLQRHYPPSIFARPDSDSDSADSRTG